MTDKTEKVATATSNFNTRGIVPFTSGLIIFVYAWFWPEGYGHWLGSIVRAFRNAAGL